jgi:hypothetical protein
LLIRPPSGFKFRFGGIERCGKAPFQSQPDSVGSPWGSFDDRLPEFRIDRSGEKLDHFAEGIGGYPRLWSYRQWQ